MIRINEKKFEMNIISKIYDNLALGVIDNFKKYEESEDKVETVIVKLKDILKYDVNENTFKNNIKDFLMNSRLAEIEKAIYSFENEKNNLDQKNFNIITEFFELSDNTCVKNIFEILNKKLGKDYTEKLGLLQQKLEKVFSTSGYERFVRRLKDLCRAEISKDTDYTEIMKFLSYNDEIKKIIWYDMLTSDQRHILINSMHVEVCPYCNRQYITNWEADNGKLYATADLDHFYLKSLYPIVSLCLYNFIPSCQICNSRFKLEKNFLTDKHIYPYEFHFGSDAKFEIDNIIDALIGYTPEFSIHFKTNNNKTEIENSINTFHLNAVYKTHTNYVQELIFKSSICKTTQIDEYLYNVGGIFRTRKEILEFIFGSIIKEKEFDKRPLTKLTYDILEDLKII